MSRRTVIVADGSKAAAVEERWVPVMIVEGHGEDHKPGLDDAARTTGDQKGKDC